nr:voltage-gated hydrogen channel 1-like [Anolis sagrei ordinatus]
MLSFLQHFTVIGDDLNQLHRDYEKWEKEEPEDAEEKMPDIVIKEEYGLKESMKKLFRSHKFQILVVILVLIDASIVLGELILELKFVDPHRHNVTHKVFHYVSLSILIIFMVEVSIKIFAFHLEFLRHKFEVFDAFVIVISFTFDIVVEFHNHQFEALGLLVLFRIWRVARIISAVMLSMKLRSHQRMSRLKKANLELLAKVQELERNCAEKEQEMEKLKKLLRQHELLF